MTLVPSGQGVAIVGASHAGVQVAASLREQGYAGPIRLIHGEGAAPYQRPPLSKAFLCGAVTAERLALRGPDWFAAKGIDLIRGARVRRLDPDARRLELEPATREPEGGAPESAAPAAGELPARLDCEAIVLATGASARRLAVPGGAAAGLLALRSLADATALRARLERADSLAVVGGGFIGLEIASSARALGKAVTVLEAQPRLLARLLHPVMAEFLRARHEAAGTRFRFGARVVAVEPGPGGGRRLRLADGCALEADLVVVGIGAEAADGLAREAGVDCADGVRVDGSGRSVAAGLFACGDCAAWTASGPGPAARPESIQAAVEQAKAVAAGLLGAPPAAPVAPWFWSDQLDLKLQIVGTALDADEVVCRGDPERGGFSLLHFRGAELVRVDSVNRAADHLAARRLVTERARPSKRAAADEAVKLKDLA